jgi:cobyrinic acid a,c-diamide synthase
MTLACMLALRRRGMQVQHFHSSARFPMLNGAASVTGLASRHLDSWLMSEPVVCELFAHGAHPADFSVIEGQLDGESAATTRRPAGSSLRTLAEWLQAPLVAVVNVQSAETYHVPRLETPVDGILLDGVGSARDWRMLSSMMEAAWKAPVLGALDPLPAVRCRLRALPVGSNASLTLCEPLAESFERYARWERIEKLARNSAFPSYPDNVYGLRLRARGVTVAVAFDDVFNCYFPDTLDLLDILGARVVDFSPLGDDRLPDRTDIVYFGCGHPERHARALGRNQCMAAALRQHVCAGGRIYAESGGLAYLCQHLRLRDGQRFPMAGVLPAEAVQAEHLAVPEPVEVHVERENWLAPVGERLRGYRNTMWELLPLGPLHTGAHSSGSADLVMRYNAIGCRLHLNFVTQPRIFRSFLRPRAPRLRSQ